MFLERSSITAVILAGGAGTRVGGRDKGLLEWHGRPLVGHALQAGASQAERFIISANRHLDIYERYGHPVVRDSGEGFGGPLAGIAAALACARTPWLLTLPVDGPVFPCDLAARLLNAASAANAVVAVAHDGARRQPLFALYATSLAPQAEASLAETDGAVWRFQDRHGAVEVVFEGARFDDFDVIEHAGYADGF